MGCGKLVLAIVLPPLAVLDKGPMAILWTTLGTICFWIPGIILAFVYNLQQKPPTVIVQNYNQPPPPPPPPNYGP
jgi:uncharacterized membrane protein YqaE (UPF0057 family)